jgi:AcrR family transcriptional regulator
MMGNSESEHTIRALVSNKKLVVKRRMHIAKCAARAFVKKGYDQTSVREIAEASEMGIGSIYRYVGSKEDILYLVIDQGLGRLSNFADEVMSSINDINPVDGLVQSMEKYYHLIDDYQDMMVFAYQEARNLQPQARKRVLESDTRIVAAFEALLNRGCELGKFRITNIPTLAHDIVVLGQMWAARRWFLRQRCTVDEYIKQHADFVLGIIGVERIPLRANASSSKTVNGKHSKKRGKL